MEKPYKAVPYNDTRYCIVSTETGEILDDAQGYGYKSVQKAYAAYTYKTRDKNKDAEKQAKVKHIRKWLKAHKEFANLMSEYAFEIAKGLYGPDGKFDAKFVARMLKDNNLDPDFTAGELLKVWRKM